MEHSKKRILVVEDEDALREMLVIVFEDEQYQVDAAIHGKEALKLLNTQHYDLMATDLFMPQMNGIELINIGQKSFPKLKIILFSGGGKEIEAEHGQNSIKFLGEEIKINMFLKKPCNLSELLNVVETLLQE